MSACDGTVTLCVPSPKTNPIQFLFPSDQFQPFESLSLRLFIGQRLPSCNNRLENPVQTWEFLNQDGGVQSEIIALTNTAAPFDKNEEFFFQLYASNPTGNCLPGFGVDFSDFTADPIPPLINTTPTTPSDIGTSIQSDAVPNISFNPTDSGVIDPSSSSGSDVVAPFVIGLVAGGILVLILFLIGAFFLFKRRKNSFDSQEAKALKFITIQPIVPVDTSIVISPPTPNPFADQSEESQSHNDAVAIGDSFRKELSNPFRDDSTVERNSTQRSSDSCESDILTHQNFTRR